MDVDRLEKSFKQLQKSVHPDLFGRRSPAEQALSAEASSNLNIAYKLLRNPVTRAQYLLQLHGVDALGEGAGSANVPPALLLQVMEARELLEDAVPGSPAGGDAVAAMLRDTAARVGALLGELGRAFAAGDLPAAAASTVALQYLTKLQGEGAEWMARHAPALQTSEAAAAGGGRAPPAGGAGHDGGGGSCAHGPGCGHSHGHGHAH